MSSIYFISPEKPQIAKYCEGFYNYLTYGYKTWSRDRYITTQPREKEGQSRLLVNKNAPLVEEMKAGDLVLERIYQKVITSDCYTHEYRRIDLSDIEQSKLIVFITNNNNPKKPPSYLYTEKNSVVVWKVSNINVLSSNKYSLLETLIRRISKPND